ncbi:hypothetical protein ABJI51_29035 [Amycolatopsis sp. NEAU-NG30]|uniref:Uncharacterized protein n=1 Tax=Amycolatopsis melonis TaxID=3156488 RepID=A0ABV0LLG6_9PSEU
MKVAEGPLTAAQIYEQLTGGEGTQSLIDAHDSTDQLGKRLAERAEPISAPAVKTTNGWQGSAGNVAADATVPLVTASVDVVHLKNAQNAVEAQITAFGTAKTCARRTTQGARGGAPCSQGESTVTTTASGRLSPATGVRGHA